MPWSIWVTNGAGARRVTAATERRASMAAVREVVAGVGVAGIRTDVVLELGPHHPSTHGALRLALTVDGDRVVRAEPLVGLLHRGAEKLFEVRDYRQLLVLANRHDWLAAFGNELGICLAVERMLGLAVPLRAVWLRTLLAELTRVHAHLMFLGAFPPSTGLRAAVEREALLAVLEEATGGRVHYMANQVGGLKQDVPAGWTGRVRAAVDVVRRSLPALATLVAEAPRGVGVLPAATALSYGVSGPVARASGVDLDLRRDEPYLAYGELAVPVVLRADGDCHARLDCLREQVAVSLELVEACLDRLPPGPVKVRLPKLVRAPEGHTYAWTENPHGISGYYLVSRGETTPWRLKLRSASFNNVSALGEVLAGSRVSDLVPILASFFFVVGDIDK